MAEEGIMSVPVVVKTRDGKQSQGKVTVAEWIKPMRMKRAMKMWGIFWGLMVASVFLPVAHFFLVPAFFLAGPIAAYIVYRQESAVLGGESVCPKCGKPLPIERGPNKWPLEDLCGACQTHVLIERA